MTEAEAIARVDEIRNVSRDDEVAHSREDELRRDVLRAIVQGARPAAARRLAEIALSTEEIDFARWCA